MIILVAIFLILFEACFEGLKLAGFHIASELVEMVYLSGITLGLFAYFSGQKSWPYKSYFIKILIGYVLLRFAIFDVIFNLSAGLSLNYIGDTKLFDKGLNWLREMWGMSPVWFLRGIAGFWGITWLTGYKQ